MQSRREFAQLKQGQQDIINKLLAGRLAISQDVASLLRLSTDAIIAEIGTSERRTAARQAGLVNENQRKVFLDSLCFPEMLDRRDSIENRINDFGTTCRWIFDEERNREHGFLNWLESGSSIYWISGKPGSGKSSVMDYIIQNVQEHDVAAEHISRWASGSKVLVLSHFFFTLGKSDLQRNFQGLWRTLCYQLLETQPDLFSRVVNDKIKPRTVWTTKDLKQLFTCLLAETTAHCKILLCVDGLDECIDEQDTLTQNLRLLAGAGNKIKICCASRSEDVFQDAFKLCPSLKMQQFNRNDMESYCKEKLEGNSRSRPCERYSVESRRCFLVGVHCHQ